MIDCLHIFSQNCQGLGNFQKRRDLFHYVKSKNYNIVCLQDVHIQRSMESYVKAEWGFDAYFSSFSSNKRGVMVLINSNFDQKVENIKTDPSGNFIILDMVIQGKKITLVNLYGPNEDNPQFYNNLQHEVSEFDNEYVIMCGDWNLVLNPDVDTQNYLHINNPKARQVVLNLIKEYILLTYGE